MTQRIDNIGEGQQLLKGETLYVSVRKK